MSDIIQTFPKGSGGKYNNGFYKTTDTITAEIDAITTLDITNIVGLSMSDVIIGETIIYDSLGTNAIVTVKDDANNTVDTKTISVGGTTHYYVDRTGQELKSVHAVLTSDWTATLNGTVPFIKQSGSFISPSDGIFTIPDGTTIELIAGISSNPHGDSVYLLYNNTDNVVINDFQWIDPYAVSPYYKTTVYITQWKNDIGHDVNISMRCTNPNNSSKLIKKETTLSIKEIGRIVDPIQYTSNNDELEETPVGNIISYMGNSVPKHHLACDGTEYAIGTYPELEAHIIKEFGSINYFGGDGTTTWAVPDLNGEFLRGTGTNGHTASGDGANVGIHQSATGINPGWVNNQAGGFSLPVAPSSDYSALVVDAGDKYVNTGKRKSIASSTDLKEVANTTDDGGYWTVRPTNTSVKFCIKYESTYHVIVPSHMYKVNATFDLAWNSTDQAYIINTLTYKSGDQSLIDGSLFKAPLTGWYNISFNSGQVAKTTKIMQYLHIVHNGTATIYTDGSNSDTNTGWWGLDINRIFYLEKGDTVYARVWTEGQTITLPTNMNASFCLLTANYKDNIIAGGEVYSTEEQLIGTWTDGKPLYQKTLVNNTATSGSKDLIIGTISDAETIFIVGGFYINNTSDVAAIGAVMDLNTSGRNSDTRFASYTYVRPNGNVGVYYGSATATTKTVATVRYTKTTDQANTYQYKNSLLLTRPDMWEPNTEYDFGGGLYGQRFTGNMPAIAAGKAVARIFQYTISSSASIVSYGGHITGKNASGTRVVITPNSVRRAQQDSTTLAMGWTSILILDNILLMNAGSYSNDYFTTSDTYDVWVTYKK